MSASASASRRTRASMAASTSASAFATASRTRSATSSRRKTTTALSRSTNPPVPKSLLDDPNDSDRYPVKRPWRVRRPEIADDEALDELLVLEQLTPRSLRINLDTTPNALERFRSREMRSQRAPRVSVAEPPTSRDAARSTSRSQGARAARLSAPQTSSRTSDMTASRSMHTARSRVSAAPTTSRLSRRSLPNVADLDDSSVDESAANTTIARPGQRLRPSLANPEGRLDVPTIEERCAALVINAKGVLHFYMDLYTHGWRPESFADMLRNWTPFESYKTNQLLAEAQYMHHFIDIDEVSRSLRASGLPRPEGFQEAMKMANCATFVHYIHQLPTDPAMYGRRSGSHITSEDVVQAPLRNISELSDARRVFLRWILPFDWELTDEVLNMLLDMSIQIYIHRVERIVEAVRAGEMSEETARSAVSDQLTDLMNGDVVRHSLQRVKSQRNMSRSDIEWMVRRYETFANVRQIDLQAMQYDYEAMREDFSFHNMSADFTGYVRDVVREVDAGMHSTTLPLIIDRLARESSVFSSSDVPDVIPSSSSVLDHGYDDSSSQFSRPTQSTPKASTRATQASQPFASQYAQWLDEMADEDDEQASQADRGGDSQGANAEADLTATQKMRELDAMLESSLDDEETGASTSVDLDIASSPPRSGKLNVRLSAGLNSSGRAAVRVQPQSSEVEVSETSDATGTLEPRRNRDGPFDSPAKEKASRLGFDSQNRLVRRKYSSARKNQRLLDGSASAVRESRFDSQGEEEEDVFLENAVQGRRRSKRKGKAKATPQAVEDDQAVAQTTPRPRRYLRSRPAPTVEREESPDSEPQTARRLGSRGPAKQLQFKEESISPAKARAQAQRTEQENAEARRSSRLDERNNAVEPAASNVRVTRSRAGKGAIIDGGATGLGRGLPDGEGRGQGRILSTASGRLLEEGEGSDYEQDEAENDQQAARNRVEGVNAELEANRPTPDEQFIGDDDEAVLDRRAALDAAIASRKPRPGTLHFYRPAQEDDAMPLLGLDDDGGNGAETADAIAMRNADSVAAILRTNDAPPQRRIGPYRPGDARSREPREERDPSIDHYSENEVDELIDENPATSPRRRRGGRTHVEPLGQSIRVEPYKRSNLYVTGHNMTGRSRWSDAEVSCLLSALHELARYKKVAPKFKVYTEILRRHGVNGTQSRTLARWNNVQLKDKSRNELIRMKREGMRIPYWKRLLHPNIWKPPPAPRAAREETEDVPELGEDEAVPTSEAENAHDPNREAEAEEGAGDGIEVVIDGGGVDGDEEGVRSFNPLRNDP